MITDKLINIIISDKGIGIPSDEVGNIYKPFKRASNVKYIGGFGIGLSLVSKIMVLQNAELKISSKENEMKEQLLRQALKGYINRIFVNDRIQISDFVFLSGYSC